MYVKLAVLVALALVVGVQALQNYRLRYNQPQALDDTLKKIHIIELELTPCIETRGILLSRRRHTQAALEKEQNEHWKIVWKKRIAENLVKNEIWLLKKNIKDIGQKIKNLKDLAMLTQQPPTPTPKSG